VTWEVASSQSSSSTGADFMKTFWP
jgi:hypothetical protein